MTNSWRSCLHALPRLSARGCLLLGGGLIFLVLHYHPKNDLAVGVLKSIPWGDRVLLSGAWFMVSLVLLSLIMVTLGRLVFLASGQRGGTRPIELIAMFPGKQGDWKLGFARHVPMISARLSWVGNDFIRAGLNSKGQEWLSATQRGWACNPQRKVVFEDFFGLARACGEQVVASSEEVVVYPQNRRPEPMVNAPRLLSASDQGHLGGKSEGDRTESREYTQGEPMRHMLWQVAARTGGQRLYVRVPETAGEEFFRVIFLPGKEDEEAAQLADYLLRENPWGTQWLFSIAGDQHTWGPDAFLDARKALARSANRMDESQNDTAIRPSPDAAVYLVAANSKLPEKLTGLLDPSKTLFLVTAGKGDDRMVAELSALGFNSRKVTMIERFPDT